MYVCFRHKDLVNAKSGVRHQLNSTKKRVLVNAQPKTNVCPQESSNQIFVTVHAQIRKLVISLSFSTRPPVIVIVGSSSAESHKLRILKLVCVNVQSKQHAQTISFLIKSASVNVLILESVHLNSISTTTLASVSAEGLRTVRVINISMKPAVNVNVKAFYLVQMVECTVLIHANVNVQINVIQNLNTKKAHVNVFPIQILVANHYVTKKNAKDLHVMQETASKYT